MPENRDINPMNASPRCTATSKRTRQKCRSPAVNGWNVCRLHGAGGGAPCGERHGQYRHGMRTKQAIEERRTLSRLRRMVRETLSEPWFR